MPNLPGLHDDVYFGDMNTPLPNWRELPDTDEDTPITIGERKTLVGMLGFDPREQIAGSSESIETANAPPAALSIEATSDSLPHRINVPHHCTALKAVIVGRSDNDVLPAWYPSFMDPDGNEVAGPDTAGMTKAEYNPSMAARAVRQTDALCELLEREGVKVYRPPLIPIEVAKADIPGVPDSVGLGAAWVRECITVIGNRVVVNQPRAPFRNKDSQALEPFLAALTAARRASVHRLPACPLDRNDDWEHDLRPFLEGGDVFHLGKDVLVTMSYLATSPTGFRWLADLLEPDGIQCWLGLMTREWEHGDYIFMPVREGLCVAYVQGFTDGILPAPCTDWDCIPLTRDEANSGFAANGIVLRENVVLLPAGNKRVVRALGKKGVDTIEVPYDGVYYWQGAIDCTTAGLWRE